MRELAVKIGTELIRCAGREIEIRGVKRSARDENRDDRHPIFNRSHNNMGRPGLDSRI
jgi:hypothetical protein